MIEHILTILPNGMSLPVRDGENLLAVLQQHGLIPDSPCGGHGICKKCLVQVNGCEVLACHTVILENTTVVLPPQQSSVSILTAGISVQTNIQPVHSGSCHLAYDIGTTTVVCYLLDGQTGKELATASMQNPQSGFGADVISRIQYALQGQMAKLTQLIRDGMTLLAQSVCGQGNADASQIGTVSVVGNPCMQQLFLGISPENLATIPFAPVLTSAEIVDAKDYLPICSYAKLLIVPDISGYVGSDTLACILATEQYQQEHMTLMVDIGTNGEMVLGNKKRMIACSTAAGPALEGAKIQCGMRGANGAIDRVWLEDGVIRCHVIGDLPAAGICGSGLIDAIAALLETGAINHRGRIQTSQDVPSMSAYLSEKDGQRIVYLTDAVYLTQQDIREVQLAKGAIATGISLMATHLDIAFEDIAEVYLAGAFGSAIRPESAVKIGLLPTELLSKTITVGNAAGSGAKLLALNNSVLSCAESLANKTEHFNLSTDANFQETFVENMLFHA